MLVHGKVELAVGAAVHGLALRLLALELGLAVGAAQADFKVGVHASVSAVLV